MSDVFKAVSEGRFDEAHAALEADPSVARATNERGSTLLMVAASKGALAVCERLVALGADVNAARADGASALRFAVTCQQPALALRLLELGASASHDAQPIDLLRHALNSGVSLATALLRHGLRLDVPNPNGEPLLYVLARSTSVDTLRAYVAAGGSLDVRWGRATVLQTAAHANQVELVEFLIANGGSASEALAAAIARDAVDVIEKLVDVDTDAVVAWLGELDVKPVREALMKRGVALPSNPRGQLLTTAETKAFFDQRGMTSRLEAWWPHELTEGRATLLPGGTTMSSLQLDFGATIKAGIIVDGDLTIDGTLANGEYDFGPFLVVLGNLSVKNVAICGAPLHVDGNLHVGTFHGFYNHGSTRVEGALDAGLFLAQDYGVVLNGPVRGDIVEVRGLITSKKPLTMMKVADVLAPEFLSGEDWPDDRAIARALIAGRSIRK